MHNRGVDRALGGALIHRSVMAALALLGALVSAPAIAARSFFTDYADVIEPHNCEMEFASTPQHARASENERSDSAPLACGVGLQTGIAGARVSRGNDHWPAFAFVGKTALRRLDDGQLGVALAYSVVAEKLPGDDFKQSRASALLVATESRMPVLIHANLGVTHDRIVGSNTNLWAFAAEHVGERLGYGAEAFGEGTRSAWLGAGARYAVVPDRVILDTAFAARSNSSRARRATIGLTLAF